MAELWRQEAAGYPLPLSQAGPIFQVSIFLTCKYNFLLFNFKTDVITFYAIAYEVFEEEWHL